MQYTIIIIIKLCIYISTGLAVYITKNISIDQVFKFLAGQTMPTIKILSPKSWTSELRSGVNELAQRDRTVSAYIHSMSKYFYQRSGLQILALLYYKIKSVSAK